MLSFLEVSIQMQRYLPLLMSGLDMTSGLDLNSLELESTTIYGRDNCSSRESADCVAPTPRWLMMDGIDGYKRLQKLSRKVKELLVIATNGQIQVSASLHSNPCAELQALLCTFTTRACLFLCVYSKRQC